MIHSPQMSCVHTSGSLQNFCPFRPAAGKFQSLLFNGAIRLHINNPAAVFIDGNPVTGGT
jgi:hypothetical protein